MNVILCNIMSYCIYKIVCDDLPEYIYVGSTIAFRQRKLQHKINCNNGHTQKLYTTIRENGGWDNWRMVIIEECGEVSLTQARIKEEENRLKLNANMNMLRCHLTEEELKEQKKQYYEANIEKIREYREANKEKMKEYNKQYGEVNKEKISEQKKQYHQANKEKINEQKKQTFTCECGRTITLGDKARHLKSNVHTNFINNKII
jgi:DNA gyrase/topoisomerase IV subunit A